MLKRKALLIALLAFAWAVPAYAAGPRIPELRTDAPQPPFSPAGYGALLVIDDGSGKTLFDYHATSVRTAASLTKLMTTSVFTSTPTNWSAKAKILKADEVGGGRLRVSSGSVMTLRDVLYSAIIGSANNCAMALGRMFNGKGIPSFVSAMNAKAKDLGLAQASFADPSGMNPKNLVSAYDVATLLSASARDPETQKAMQLASYTFTVASPKVVKTIKTTDDLIVTASDLDVSAGKTGYLEESMYNFTVRAAPKGDPSKSLTVVVLGAPTRKESIDASEALARWAWSAYAWTAATSTSAPAFTRDLGMGDKGEDVRALQKFLNAHGAKIAASGPGSPGKETTLFGDLTRIALAKFQTAHSELLSARGATSGSGYLDAMTRAFIHEGLK